MKRTSYIFCLQAILALALGISQPVFAAKNKKLCQLAHGCTSTEITQCKLKKHDGIYLIDKPGKYHLASDTRGTIIIRSSDVCLDLCCHTLDAAGRSNAIVIGNSLASASTQQKVTKKADVPKVKDMIDYKAKVRFSDDEYQVNQASTTFSPNSFVSGFHNISVSNGSIVGSTRDGISVNSCFDVELHDLNMSRNALNSIHGLDSSTVQVTNVHFNGDSTGERALLFENSDNLFVKLCTAIKYLSTFGAIIEFDVCNDVYMDEVNVTNNTKTSPADAYFYNAGTALVFAGGLNAVYPSFTPIQGCTNVHFNRVKVDNNIFNNTIEATDPLSNAFGNFRTAEAIAIIYSRNCTLTDCTTNNNVDIAGNVATFDTEDYPLLLWQCQNAEVIRHQSNNFVCDDTLFVMTAIIADGCQNVLFDSCQANNNFVQAFTPTGIVGLVGLWNASFAGSSTNHMVKNCQGCFNRIGTGTANRAAGTCTVTGIECSAIGSVIDNCQWSNNTIGDFFTGSYVWSALLNRRDVTMVNSIADYNTGGEHATGVVLWTSGSATSNRGAWVQNCSCVGNGNYGITIGADRFPIALMENILIENCLISKTGAANSDVAGITVLSNVTNTRNVVIKECQVFETGLTTSTSAYGISGAGVHNFVIEDTNVFTTTSAGTAHGILLNGVNSKILRTQVHSSKNDGINLAGEDNIVQHCFAMDNGGTGFNDTSAFANAWFGNKTQDNVAAFAGVTAGNIATYSNVTGVFAGGPSPNVSDITNIQIN